MRCSVWLELVSGAPLGFCPHVSLHQPRKELYMKTDGEDVEKTGGEEEEVKRRRGGGGEK